MSPRLGDRALFPDLAARSYLAHCAISPIPAPARAAAVENLDSYARLGVGAVPRWLEQRAALRDAFGRLVGARGEDIALVANTTTGVIDVAFSIPWRAGDRVVLFEGEFPANVTPWQQAAATFGLAIVRVPLQGFGRGGDPRDDGLARLAEVLRGGARLVAVSAVQFSTGLAMPLREIAALCRAHGAELFVDGIQAVGVVPVDVGVGIDYLTCGSHKWLMGAEGCAALYVAPERARALVPRLAGWISHEEPFGFLWGAAPLRHDRPFKTAAGVFEGAAANGAGLAALGAAVGLLEALGVPAIVDHVQRWHDAIEPALVERGFTSLRGGPGARSGILALDAPAGVDVQAVVKGLAARGVVVTAPENHLRVAEAYIALGDVE
ncbi:MAG: aminotransferase class V-fold PLP-dependent enzyme, partial [Myxococcota bacterium]